jgi:hypothetical protein
MNAGHSVAGAIEWWCDKAERVIGFTNTWPRDCLSVNYEDLVGDPEETLREIFEFVHVEVVPGVAERALRSSRSHGIGRGDYKIAGTNRIRRDSVGLGLTMDLSGVPLPVLARMTTVLERVGYSVES